MKNNSKIMILSLLFGLSFTGCDEFLDVPPDARLNDKVIFSTYNTAQGFLDTNYDLLVDPNNYGFTGTCNYACESAASVTASPVFHALNTNYNAFGQTGRSYWQNLNPGFQSPFNVTQDGIYDFWPFACRVSNLALANLDLLQASTPELLKDQKDKLEGQALFFRAYFNFEIMRAYGSIPYLDKVYDATDNQRPRFYVDEASGKKNIQAAHEKAARDLRRAADLLPVRWGPENLGRITKGAALGMLTRVLLSAGSPLMEEEATTGRITTTDTGYNIDYMRRAATVAAELLALNEYAMTPFGTITATGLFTDGEEYRKMFTTTDGTVPYTTEIIFKKWIRSSNASGGQSVGKSNFDNNFARSYAKGPLGAGVGGVETPLIQFMDKFEMRDGTQYKIGNRSTGGFDDDFQQFFKNRDPRFDFNYYLHQERIGSRILSFETRGLGYFGTTAARGPFMMSKYWFPNADNINNQFGQYVFATPLLRLADIYLMYAEAVFEATGNVDGAIGGTLTARQALNIVRARVRMPDYNPATYAVARPAHGELSSDHPFRLALRNELAVEFAYEGHLWWDLRRWKRFHRIDRTVSILNFNTAFTISSREVLQPFIFELRHYNLPFPVGDTQVYKGFDQNAGW